MKMKVLWQEFYIIYVRLGTYIHGKDKIGAPRIYKVRKVLK